MGYLLLTGGTGLLGEYLVRDLLTRDVKLALWCDHPAKPQPTSGLKPS